MDQIPIEDQSLRDSNHNLQGEQGLLNIQTVPLFGGAITIELPKNILDVSTFRQVPDTQEVFITNVGEDHFSKESNQSTNKNPKTRDLSIIIEVLELVNLEKIHASGRDEGKKMMRELDDINNNDPTSIITYHFNSLAYDNSSKTTQVKSIELPNNPEEFDRIPEMIGETRSPAGSSKPTPSTTTTTPGRKTPMPVKLYGLQSIAKFNQSESHDVHIWMGLWRLNGIGNHGMGTDLVLTFNLPRLDSYDPIEFRNSVHLVNRLFQEASNSLNILDWSLFA